jgi:FKBP-type peptidyl-prolyl cis-trans isomerase (trigger factor)
MREKINLDNKISRNLPPLGNLYSNSSFHVNIDQSITTKQVDKMILAAKRYAAFWNTGEEKKLKKNDRITIYFCQVGT